jgi:hypothetical protein
MISYTFTDLPKISLNDWYGGKFWAERARIKKIYSMLLTSRIKKISYPCTTAYLFEFRTRPLDASNTIAMVKMIEDIIFPDDSVEIVKEIRMKSFRSPRAKELKELGIDVVVTITIWPE